MRNDIKRQLLDFLIEYGNNIQGDDWYKVKEDDYGVEIGLDKLTFLFSQYLEQEIDTYMQRIIDADTIYTNERDRRLWNEFKQVVLGEDYEQQTRYNQVER